MSELTQTLKILVTRYPGTMAELARKASIDRSTLYKIVSGQRTPREFQLEHLADALELSEEEKSCWRFLSGWRISPIARALSPTKPPASCTAASST